MKRLIHVPMVHTQEAISDTWGDTNVDLAKRCCRKCKRCLSQILANCRRKAGGNEGGKPEILCRRIYG